MPRHTAYSNTKTGTILPSIRLTILLGTTCEPVWNHLWPKHVLIKTRPFGPTNLTFCSSCIDNSSLCLPSNLFPLQMLMNAKLQITAVISMLIVSIVQGHFLAVASQVTKETVLSANVSSKSSVDMFQQSKLIRKAMARKYITFCDKHLLFYSPRWDWSWLTFLYSKLAWSRYFSWLFSTISRTVDILNNIIWHMIDKASNLQFPYLILSWNVPIDILIPKGAKEKEVSVSKQILPRTSSLEKYSPISLHLNGYTLRFDG